MFATHHEEPLNGSATADTFVGALEWGRPPGASPVGAAVHNATLAIDSGSDGPFGDGPTRLAETGIAEVERGSLREAVLHAGTPCTAEVEAYRRQCDGFSTAPPAVRQRAMLLPRRVLERGSRPAIVDFPNDVLEVIFTCVLDDADATGVAVTVLALTCKRFLSVLHSPCYGGVDAAMLCALRRCDDLRGREYQHEYTSGHRTSAAAGEVHFGGYPGADCGATLCVQRRVALLRLAIRHGYVVHVHLLPIDQSALVPVAGSYRHRLRGGRGHTVCLRLLAAYRRMRDTPRLRSSSRAAALRSAR